MNSYKIHSSNFSLLKNFFNVLSCTSSSKSCLLIHLFCLFNLLPLTISSTLIYQPATYDQVYEKQCNLITDEINLKYQDIVEERQPLYDNDNELDSIKESSSKFKLGLNIEALRNFWVIFKFNFIWPRFPEPELEIF